MFIFHLYDAKKNERLQFDDRFFRLQKYTESSIVAFQPSSSYWRQPPPIVPVVDHLAGHSAVDADILAGDEAGNLVVEIHIYFQLKNFIPL